MILNLETLLSWNISKYFEIFRIFRSILIKKTTQKEQQKIKTSLKPKHGKLRHLA